MMRHSRCVSQHTQVQVLTVEAECIAKGVNVEKRVFECFISFRCSVGDRGGSGRRLGSEGFLLSVARVSDLREGRGSGGWCSGGEKVKRQVFCIFWVLRGGGWVVAV